MYLDHFGLQQAPFRITPHTEFFFAGADRGATLAALIYAITHDEGIVKVSGEVGSGKTMLCRMLLEKLPENVETVYLANPMLSRDDKALLAAFCQGGYRVDSGQVRAAVRDAQFRPIAARAHVRWRWAGAVIAVCGVLGYLVGSPQARSLPGSALHSSPSIEARPLATHVQSSVAAPSDLGQDLGDGR